ncbi:exonuclease SbcD [Microbacterium halimionae]|uniref:Nuclease SbcCD subunit D n=1 Tax=Microbacterium halimionae TaxID=1526413 RepID=A0A7W3PKT2_9MICO|nr:exonuclease SbcCD subunit D [Microbacterium halimionae]MBA8815291.1 exonuclease SbcD [Microbacterium halimionae]NII93918.1 exonuclease SbcD [Microbacterium halimionae]
MRILHTSDWHIGRTFHGHSTLAALRAVLFEMVDQVRERHVDVVIVAGDVFDSAAPAASCYELLTETLAALTDAGARVVMTSGNHDSAARLGFQARLLRQEIAVRTDPAFVDSPITIEDADGPVQFYCIPFLEPALVRHLWPDVEVRTHEQALTHAMNLVRADLAQRGGRSVAISHCFTAGVEATVGVERDIQQGGLDVVPLSVFDGVDYAALGHIHGRQQLSPRVRYSGAPLHYSFGEADKPRGSWLVEMDAAGETSVEWLPLAVPRRLTTLRAPLDELLGDARFNTDEQSWVAAEYTDAAPQPDTMRRLQSRFQWCASVAHVPAVTREKSELTYSGRVRAARSDLELVDAFLSHVREGEGASDAESEILRNTLGEQAAAEASK